MSNCGHSTIGATQLFATTGVNAAPEPFESRAQTVVIDSLHGLGDRRLGGRVAAALRRGLLLRPAGRHRALEDADTADRAIAEERIDPFEDLGEVVLDVYGPRPVDLEDEHARRLEAEGVAVVEGRVRRS